MPSLKLTAKSNLKIHGWKLEENSASFWDTMFLAANSLFQKCVYTYVVYSLYLCVYIYM